MTTATTPARIRWYDEPERSVIRITGVLGGSGLTLFRIFDPSWASPEWQLTTDLPGMDQKRHYAGGPDELKAVAELWLEEFVSILGAIFPAALREEIEQERAAQDEQATGHAELGHRDQEERAYGRVEALDGLLATMERLEAD